MNKRYYEHEFDRLVDERFEDEVVVITKTVNGQTITSKTEERKRYVVFEFPYATRRLLLNGVELKHEFPDYFGPGCEQIAQKAAEGFCERYRIPPDGIIVHEVITWTERASCMDICSSGVERGDGRVYELVDMERSEPVVFWSSKGL